jgi:hypothetical protein
MCDARVCLVWWWAPTPHLTPAGARGIYRRCGGGHRRRSAPGSGRAANRAPPARMETPSKYVRLSGDDVYSPG